MGIRSRNYEGGTSIIHLFPLGVRMGLIWISPEEYLARKNAVLAKLEKFRTVKIPKKCKTCGVDFDIEIFHKNGNGYHPHCKECRNKREKARQAKIREQYREARKNFDVEVKQQNYKIHCRGTGFQRSKTVTVKARSEREARKKIFEAGLIPL